jgi:hypothetical protein
MWLYVVYVCACVPYVLVCGTFGCELNQTSHRQVHQARTHPHRQHYSHIPNKQLDDANKQRSSNSTKHERRSPEDGQTIVTETCSVLIDVFYKHF